MSETFPCSGGCGLRIDKPNAWCISCTPGIRLIYNTNEEPNPRVLDEGRFTGTNAFPFVADPNPTPAKAESKTPHQLRMELWQAAYKLALGPIKERAAALETIFHLVTQLKEIK